ncbi:hypothetical protein CWATWH0402_6095 [Crocosphaera watsonii WH 0402]|uniref:Uncharacterized protein n=1 Tax=Crocosphaera watsonii WH 0402 TaxID=1284629 RepID=T2JJ00_CROWT|nr:hypothetical protein CWATWH0402_6095 [Crocosphaera watsonii WH 0402]
MRWLKKRWLLFQNSERAAERDLALAEATVKALSRLLKMILKASA